MPDRRLWRSTREQKRAAQQGWGLFKVDDHYEVAWIGNRHNTEHGDPLAFVITRALQGDDLAIRALATLLASHYHHDGPKHYER